MFKKTQNWFFISMLVHLLMLVNFVSFAFLYTPEVKHNAEKYLPAYIYQPKNNPITPPTPIKQTTKAEKPVQKKLDRSSIATERRREDESISAFQPSSQSFASTRMQMRQLKSDKSVDKPLLRLLYEATVQQLVYPQIAISFRETGVVRIKFLIHPNGQVNNVAMLRSSGYEPLDNAALDAIRAISPVRNVGVYINKPEYVEAYIEFR